MDEKVWTSRTSSNSSGKMESDICERILHRTSRRVTHEKSFSLLVCFWKSCESKCVHRMFPNESTSIWDLIGNAILSKRSQVIITWKCLENLKFCRNYFLYIEEFKKYILSQFKEPSWKDWCLFVSNYLVYSYARLVCWLREFADDVSSLSERTRAQCNLQMISLRAFSFFSALSLVHDDSSSHTSCYFTVNQADFINRADYTHESALRG